MYHHPTKQIRCLVHGDDFVSVGDPRSLNWMKDKLSGRFKIKTTTVGTDEKEGEVREARILNRVIRATDEGWEHEPGRDFLSACAGVLFSLHCLIRGTGFLHSYDTNPKRPMYRRTNLP